MKNIKFVYCYQIFTSQASWILAFLIPLIVLDIGNSAFYTSISFGISMLPYIIIPPISGIIGDFGNKKRKILILELSFLILSFLLYIYLTFLYDNFDLSSISIIYFIQLLIGIISASQHPIYQSSIPDIIPKKMLGNTNSTLSSIDSIISLMGPAVVGLLLALFSKTSLILLSCLLSLFAIISYLLIDYIEIKNNENSFSYTKFVDSFSNSIRFLINEMDMKNIVILFFMVNFSINLITSGFVYHLKYTYLFSDSQVSFTYSIIGIGTLLGAYISRYTISENVSKLKTISRVVFFMLIINLAILFFYENVFLFILLWSVIQGVSMIIVVNFFTYRQMITPTNILGGVVGITRSISYTAIPISALITGYLQNNYNTLLYSIYISIFFLSMASIFAYYKFITK